MYEVRLFAVVFFQMMFSNDVANFRAKPPEDTMLLETFANVSATSKGLYDNCGDYMLSGKGGWCFEEASKDMPLVHILQIDIGSKVRSVSSSRYCKVLTVPCLVWLG